MFFHSEYLFLIIGLHLEGPFISTEKKGAHPTDHICSPGQGLADLEAMYGSLDDVSIVTLAPELPGALDVIRPLVNKGIKVSIGLWLLCRHVDFHFGIRVYMVYALVTCCKDGNVLLYILHYYKSV